ncbi:Regucalcin [Trachymyrmex zeteki]|uniref:Regucalcin n=1 Tax=Mycetomoellerius zeteki TaxID=64791 RepID=A0A151X280_9HYME|nr:Regucalcin [Trachymyrmex zeteki]
MIVTASKIPVPEPIAPKKSASTERAPIHSPPNAAAVGMYRFSSRIMELSLWPRITICCSLSCHGTVGVVIPVDEPVDQLIVGSGKDVVLVKWDGDSNESKVPVKVLCSLDSPQAQTRINDGKVDSAGRFWLGTMGNEINGKIAPNLGTLYRVDNDLEPEKEISPVTISNGLAWNIEDDTFYYIDSPTRQVTAYDYNPNNGTISNKRIVFDLNNTNLKGLPDGMTIDADGNLWIALFGGSQVICVDPKTKKILFKVELPAENVTSVAFGGPLLDTLYVTTSGYNISAEQRQATPHAGALFAVTGLGVQHGSIGVAIPVAGMTDQFVAGAGKDVVLITWDGNSNKSNVLVKVLFSLDSQVSTRTYDGKVDSTGKLWIGTMSDKVAMNDMNKMAVIPKQGSLYRINDDLKPEKKISPVTITNKKIVFDLSKTNLKGTPDGMTIDTNGNIWIPLFGGSQVIGVRPRTGTVLCKVELPVENVISATFGGPLLDTLYVTTAGYTLDKEQNLNPQAGAVFAIKGLEVRGVPENMFKLVKH